MSGAPVGRVGGAGLIAGVLLLAACAAPGDDAEGAPPEALVAGMPSALDDLRHPSFPEPLIDVDDILSGGPPPDGIPAIDDPMFDRASEVDWLEPTEAVLSLTVGGETRGYPIQIMTWHEIVNDVVGGVPVAVTYCPLCNSGVAFEREVDGRELTFGTSGLLYADNLVMYDRQTESLWPQLTGIASVGALTGTELTAIPMGAVGWADFLEAEPDALVLNRDTGHSRSYGTNPYIGYDDPSTLPIFPLPEPTDARLTAKTRVVGIDVDGEVVAITRDRLARDGVTALVVGGDDLVVFHAAGQASSLDAPGVADGADIGSVAVFRAELDGEVLGFAPDGDAFVDDATGSRWDVLGNAVSGPLAGERLEPVTHLDTFWFAWVAFQPGTDLLR
ncbi:DUF3179 domain-containing protein [Agromyces mangrovi Wang et al. 2018]|uniref:DUF3179 domain-containing protein n=1 Tax=Agromyces mangrovi TaxID=1858653 RepID=UPI002572E844|nr:DUF3179 domain-containing protein [Agromyces mangrovi]BDZ64542.1 hypothetical protein GCM10025877_14800 [Agromyces mangrovi]